MCELKTAIFAVILGGFLQEGFLLQSCSKLFVYQRGENDKISGQLIFENDLSGLCSLEVRMALAARSNESIQLARRISDKDIAKGWKIVYEVLFPKNEITETTMPTPIRVSFNQKLYCQDPAPNGTVAMEDLFSHVNLGTRNQVATSLRQQMVSSQPQTWQPPQWPSADTVMCGTRPNYHPLVLKGAPTREGEYPWLVALLYLKSGDYSYRCAASLISNKHVVTAAHCVTKGTDKKKLLVVFGQNNIGKWGPNTISRKVERLKVHPDYLNVSYGDLAVIIIDVPVPFSDLIRPICLWNEPTDLANIVGQKGIVVGWGADEAASVYVDEARQINIPIVDQDTCIRSEPGGSFITLTSNKTFCAGDHEGKIPCRGDSGGGFVMERGGRWKLRGLVSSALSSKQQYAVCDGSHYAVFSDVAKYLPWLTKIMEDG